MTKINYLLGISFILLFLSCSSENENESKSSSNLEFEFEIVDSLLVDYLGTPVLADYSPDKSKILLFNSRNSEFIITDQEGLILSTFSKEGDIPDNPGGLADRPIFFDDTTVIAYGQKGILAYNLSGENVWKIPANEQRSYWLTKGYGRSMFILEPNKYFTIVNYDQLETNPSVDSLYEKQTAFKLVNKTTKEMEPVVPLEPFSRYLDGKGYQPANMLPSTHMLGNKMVMSFSKDKLIYLYEWRDKSFQLSDTFSIDIEPFYLDEAEERESFKEQDGFMMGGAIGEATVGVPWLLSENKVLLRYNPGIKESERKEPEWEKVGENSIRLVPPDNLPEDKYQIYMNGKKHGKPIPIPTSLSNLTYVDGDTLIFAKNNEALGVEDDYAVFYKTRIVEKN